MPQEESRRLEEEPKRFRRKTLSGALIMAFFTFFSRVLGFFRDMNTAAVMGMSGSLAMDAFVCAFRVPNLIRRLYCEGVFTFTYIPVFSEYWMKDRRLAWRLLASFLRFGAVLGGLVVVLGEIGVLGAFGLFRPASGSLWAVTLNFLAIMFPYAFFVTLAAQCAATLQGMGRFTLSGMIPSIFNIFWLTALFIISPFGIYLPVLVSIPCQTIFGIDFSAMTQIQRGMVLSGTVVLASIAQFLIQMFWLRRLGARFFTWTQIKSILTGRKNGDDEMVAGTVAKTADGEQGVEESIARRMNGQLIGVFKKMIPATAGLLFLQLSAFLATIFSLLFAVGQQGKIPLLSSIPGLNEWLAGTTRQGAAAAIYFSERLYEFPLAFIGISIGSAFFPLLVRHIQSRSFEDYVDDLALGIRLILIFSIPAGIGLSLISMPLTHLFYMRGEFSSEDAFRTSRIISLFSCGVPAFCLSSFLIRGFYAQGDLRRPLNITILSLILFLAAALFSVHFGGELGLVGAIVGGSYFQTLCLFYLTWKSSLRSRWGAILKTGGKSLVSSFVMAAGILAAGKWMADHFSEFWNRNDSVSELAQLGGILSLGVLIYGLCVLVWGGGRDLIRLRAVRKDSKRFRKE